MSRIFMVLFLLIFGMSCKHTSTTHVDVSAIKVNLKLVRFDSIFATTDATNLSQIKHSFPIFFPDYQPDTTWINLKKDSMYQYLQQDISHKFKDFSAQKKEITALMQHIKYYYPKFNVPKIYTLNSMLDVEKQIVYADSLVVISLDTYLGEKNPVYQNYPEYLQKKFNPDRITPDLAKVIAEQTTPNVPYRLFVEHMVSEGKIIYATQLFLPHTDEAKLLNYTAEQLAWANENSKFIWQYFLEKEYLYSSDRELQRRFLDPAPFSKFYTAADNESPGQIGLWLGLQIVKSYVDVKNVSLPQLMATPPMQIFEQSKYKP